MTEHYTPTSVVEVVRAEAARVLAKLDELIAAVQVQNGDKKDGKESNVEAV